MQTKYFRQVDFANLDFSRLKQGEFATNGDNFSFIKGGAGYPGGTGWCISIFDDEVDEVWELPTCLSRFVDWAEENGKVEAKGNIRRALGF